VGDLMVEYEEHPYRITEKDPNVEFVAPSAVVAGQEFEIWEFTAPVLTSFVFEEGMQIFASLRTTAAGNPELPLDTVVKLVKTDPNKLSRIEVVVAPYGQWRELVDALKKLTQTETWKLEQQFKLLITYIPKSTADVISEAHSQFLLESIRVSPKLTL